jgi:Xaa-Pro aminopeptidase
VSDRGERPRASDRLERLAERLDDAGVDALLVTNLVNLRYLTGYTGSNGLALVGREIRRFATDFRYREQVKQEVEPSFERVEVERDLLGELDALLPARPLRLGFEARHLSVAAHERLRELLPDRVELTGVNGMIEAMREVKAPEEVARIRAAAALADDAFAELLEAGIVGRTEREVALALDVAMRRRGAERPSFETIVAAGPHGALPHATPRETEIRRGQLVVIDWGAQLDGYCSDCTRTLAAGAADAHAEEVYRLVADAQRAGLAAVRAGVGCRDADAAARRVIEASSHGERFGHGLGHGVGLEVHEAPRLSRTCEGELAAGNVVTVEPGVYLPGSFGVRIEDLVVVGADAPELLTGISKELTVTD